MKQLAFVVATIVGLAPCAHAQVVTISPLS